MVSFHFWDLCRVPTVKIQAQYWEQQDWNEVIVSWSPSRMTGETASSRYLELTRIYDMTLKMSETEIATK